MPYEIKKNGESYEVINKDTGEVKAAHTTHVEAEKQVRLLHAIENDPSWE
jgi:hypothetical protein